MYIVLAVYQVYLTQILQIRWRPIGGMRALLTLVSFVAILWGLSGTLTIPMGSSSARLPGYLVWAALLYATAGTWLTKLDWPSACPAELRSAAL
jgi:hypothetical protein